MLQQPVENNDEPRMTNDEGIPKSKCQMKCGSPYLAGSDFERIKTFGTVLEHVTFAPIEIPGQP